MGDRWPLIGREAEIHFVGESLAGGENTGVVIAGRAGVGKTRLAREIAAAMAADGWAVSRVAGTATGRPVMLAAFARWIDDFDATPVAMVRQVIAALTADAGGAELLVFVDDAHLLDDLSALVVHQLVMQQVGAVIATIRTGESSPDAVTSLWKSGSLERLELQPISRVESDELLRSVLGAPVSADCAGRMWKLTRGNVLFLRHLVEQERESGRLASESGEWRWTGTPSVSPSLTDLVELDIGTVPEDVQQVVDLVAIAEPIDRSTLASLATREAIETAEDRGLISASSTGDEVYVGHPLYGEVRLNRSGPLRLRRLRGSIATAMTRSQSQADPLRLGLLWLESDLPPDPIVLSRAANIARSRLDLGLAERLAQAAVNANTSAATKLQLAYILFLREKGTDAEDLLDTIEAQHAPATGFLNLVILRSANQLWVLRDPESSWDVLEDALNRRDGVRADDLRAFRGVQLALAARPADAVEAMVAVDYDRLDQFGRILCLCAETLALGDLGRPIQAAAKARAGYVVVGESPQSSFQGTGLTEFHAQALLAAGYVDDAVAVAEHRLRQCADLPGLARSMATAVVGMTALAKGDLTTAVRCLGSAETAIGDYGEISGIFYRFRILHTEALARSGHVAAAIEALEATCNSRHPAYRYVESAYLLAEAWVAAARGRVAEARKISSRAVEFARTQGQPAREVIGLQAAAQFGATDVDARLADLATQVDGPRATVSSMYAHVLAVGDAAGLEAASRDFENMGDVLAAADAAAQAATCYRHAGRRGAALTASARAHRLAQRCGGASSPALNAARLAIPFTQREREIAVLVSQGLSNRQIAEAMSLSVRTVEGHVYRAGVKAGVATRSELSSVIKTTRVTPRAERLLQLGEDGALGDGGAGFDREAGDDAGLVRVDGVLHLHRLEHDDQVPGGHCLAFLHGDLHHRALHRGGDGVTGGGAAARPPRLRGLGFLRTTPRRPPRRGTADRTGPAATPRRGGHRPRPRPSAAVPPRLRSARRRCRARWCCPSRSRSTSCRRRTSSPVLIDTADERGSRRCGGGTG